MTRQRGIYRRSCRGAEGPLPGTAASWVSAIRPLPASRTGANVIGDGGGVMSVEISFIMILPVLLLGAMLGGAAVLVWWERRLLGFWQDRLGPQPGWTLRRAADGGRHHQAVHQGRLGAAVRRPGGLRAGADGHRRRHAAGFAVVPFGPDLHIIDLNIGVLFFLGMTSLAVYGVLLGGLASNNKYALLGGLRSGRADGHLRGVHGPVADGRGDAHGLVQPERHRRAQEDLWFCVPSFSGFVVFLIAGIAESPPPAVRPAGGGARAHRRFPHRVLAA